MSGDEMSCDEMSATDGETYPDFKQTATFLKVIRKWWNIVNVGSKFTGEHKRDETKYPVTKDNLENNRFLRSFADFIFDLCFLRVKLIFLF